MGIPTAIVSVYREPLTPSAELSHRGGALNLQAEWAADPVAARASALSLRQLMDVLASIGSVVQLRTLRQFGRCHQACDGDSLACDNVTIVTVRRANGLIGVEPFPEALFTAFS
jgi:hypothetical protein